MTTLPMPRAAGETRAPKPATPALAPSWRARLAGRIARSWRARRAGRALYRLDDRTLHDLGIERCGVEYAARFGRD